MRSDNGSRSASARREWSDAAPQALQDVEALTKRRRSEVVLAAQMVRQSLIIVLFTDYSFSENGVQRVNTQGCGIQRAQHAIR